MIDLQIYFTWVSKNTLKYWMFAIFILNTMAARQTSKQNIIMIFLGLESNPKNLKKKTAYIYIYIYIYMYVYSIYMLYICYIYIYKIVKI